jgi:hypothetical protein
VLQELRHNRLHLRELEELVSVGRQILADERRSALLALLRSKVDSLVYLLRRPRGPLVSRMSRLAAGSAPRRLLRPTLCLLFGPPLDGGFDEFRDDFASFSFSAVFSASSTATRPKRLKRLLTNASRSAMRSDDTTAK